MKRVIMSASDINQKSMKAFARDVCNNLLEDTGLYSGYKVGDARIVFMLYRDESKTSVHFTYAVNSSEISEAMEEGDEAVLDLVENIVTAISDRAARAL